MFLQGGAMKRKNHKLVQAIFDHGTTQNRFHREAGLTSEARLSRIINMVVAPTPSEIGRISKVLQKSPNELGFE